MSGDSKSRGIGRGAKKGGIIDQQAADQLKKDDPDLYKVVDCLGYVPECFSNLELSKLFDEKLGRSVYQARMIVALGPWLFPV